MNTNFKHAFSKRFEGLETKETDLLPCSSTSIAEGSCPNEALSKKVNEILPGGVVQSCDEKGCIEIKNPKSFGPKDTDELISNRNIMDKLYDWQEASLKDFFVNGPTKAISFEMSNFIVQEKSELRDIDLEDLKKKGFKSFCCVLNTDSWRGGGKHWVCLFGVLKEKKCSIEYFNSSGRSYANYTFIVTEGDLYTCPEKINNLLDMNSSINKIRNSIEDWVTLLKEKFKNYQISIKNVVTRVLQESETECGVWSLWYIKSRLEGKEPDYFIINKVTDKAMLKYARKALFI